MFIWAMSCFSDLFGVYCRNLCLHLFVFQIDLVYSVGTLYKFVEEGKLPVEIGGTHYHDHKSWLNFRMVGQMLSSRLHSIVVLTAMVGCIDYA